MKSTLQVVDGGKENLFKEGRRLLFRGICLGDQEALRRAQEEVYPRLARRAKLSLAVSPDARDRS